MKIAIIGYGKMGKAIEKMALQKGHTIVLKITGKNVGEMTSENLQKADVAIEFSGPAAAFENIKKCMDAGLPVVCGSTGWTDKMDEIKNYCTAKNGAFIYASNFSVGVNIFFEINKRLAQFMSTQELYEVILEETHHTEKKDAPSGTAITLANQILESVKRKTKWVNTFSDDPADLEIISQRIDPTPGTHHVKYSSVIDDIEIIHTAHNRNGFALGAVLAASFLQNKKGCFTMKDVLHL